MSKAVFALLGASMLLGACSRVTVRTSGETPLIREADWQDKRPFFMYGLVGTHRVDAAKICGDRGVEQVSLETTFWDGVIKYATFLILTPKTAKVWCYKERKG